MEMERKERKKKNYVLRLVGSEAIDVGYPTSIT
jgi:hypothetical protein